MSNNLISGKRGEDLAADYLVGIGYKILERNYRYQRSEIDIISIIGETLVFVEVKFRSGDYFGSPEQSIGLKKEEQVLNAADNYIFENNWNGPVRFDVIAVLKDNSIEHFEDVFG